MSMLRCFSNLHRGMKLLKVIAAKKTTSDLDAVVEEAIIQADEIPRKIQHQQDHLTSEIHDVEKKLSKKILQSAKEIGNLEKAISSTIDNNMSSLQKKNVEVLAIVKDHLLSLDQTMEATNSESKNISLQLTTLKDFIYKQQEQVRKYQEGYDWVVLKNFALRIIRCVDRIEKRMEEVGDVTLLEELGSIKYELLFALQATGVEQVVPEKSSPYEGKEKWVKIVNTVESSDCTQAKCIAEVFRPAYFISIDEENQKVIRVADVSVYEFQGEVEADA